LLQRAAQHALDVGRAGRPGRSSIVESKMPTIVDFDADRDRAASTIRSRSVRRGRFAHGRPWSADVPRQVGRRRQPPGGRTRAGCSRATGWAVSGSRRFEPRGGEIGDAQSAVLGSTSVSGPGQNASASRSAAGVKTAIRRAAASRPHDDQRIERRRALGLVKPGNCGRIGGIRAQP